MALSDVNQQTNHAIIIVIIIFIIVIINLSISRHYVAANCQVAWDGVNFLTRRTTIIFPEMTESLI